MFQPTMAYTNDRGPEARLLVFNIHAKQKQISTKTQRYTQWETHRDSQRHTERHIDRGTQRDTKSRTQRHAKTDTHTHTHTYTHTRSNDDGCQWEKYEKTFEQN